MILMWILAVFFGGCVASAYAQPAVVQSNTDALASTVDGTIVLTGVTAGNTIVVFDCIASTVTADTVTISDNVNGVWANASVQHDSGINTEVMAGYLLGANNAGGDITVTIDRSGITSENHQIAICEVSNAGSVDVNFNNEVTNPQSTSHSLFNPAANFAADSIVFAGIVIGGTTTFTEPADDWELVSSNNSGFHTEVMYKTYPSGSSTNSATCGSSSSRYWVSIAFSLKDSGGGGSPVPTIVQKLYGRN